MPLPTLQDINRFAIDRSETAVGEFRAFVHAAGLRSRAEQQGGRGHAVAGSSRAGVNGLYDMGANVWEWVDGGSGNERLTLGGSWWYGAAQMHRAHRTSKSPDTAVVYIGFRCVKDLKR